MTYLNNSMTYLKHIYRETSLLFSDNRPISISKRLYVVLYSLPNFRLASTWLKSADNPLLAKELSQRPRVREFLYRPYLNKYWKVTERLAVIANHYKLVSSNAPILNLAPDESLELTQFDMNDQKLRVVIDRPEWMRREGEIGLSFFLGVDRIYTIMFLLGGDSSNMKIIVGNLQGDGRDKAETYKEITKAFYGMRPRDFLINVLKIIGKELGCKEIYGISDDAHRSNIWYSKAFKQNHYDTIWLEHGGKKDDTGFFVLPSHIAKRTDDEIPTKKRAVYRRRYEFLDELQLKLEKVVHHPPPKMHINIRQQETHAIKVRIDVY
ncbi:MAG TPA: DUF535 family protein [Methylotenera sp.]|nr:DUF535 family protein [Methylotenera sp.]